jgi:hypothetical protein
MEQTGSTEAGLGQSPPSPPAAARRLRGPRLDSPVNVRLELCRLYRAARAGDLPVDAATKLGHLLSLIARCLQAEELAELQARIEALEASSA